MKKSIYKLIYVLSIVAFFGVNLQAQKRVLLQVEHACMNNDQSGEAVAPPVVKFTVTAINFVSPQVTYDYGYSGATETTTNLIHEHTYLVQDAGTYYATVTVTDLSDGMSVTSAPREVILHAAPTVQFNFGEEPLLGCVGSPSVQLIADLGGDDENTSILWKGFSGGGFTQDITTQSAVYQKLVSAVVYREYEDGNVCFTKSKQGTVTILPKPTVQATTNHSYIYRDGSPSSAQLGVVSGTATNFEWIPAVDLSNSRISNPVFTPHGEGAQQYQYSVKGWFTLENGFRCESISEPVIISTIASAGGDMNTAINSNKVIIPESSYNNTWTIRDASWYAGAELTILNRWGMEVYKVIVGTDNNVWNGKTKAGKDLPTDAYYYILKGTNDDGNEVTHTGSISILHK